MNNAQGEMATQPSESPAKFSVAVLNIANATANDFDPNPQLNPSKLRGVLDLVRGTQPRQLIVLVGATFNAAARVLAEQLLVDRFSVIDIRYGAQSPEGSGIYVIFRMEDYTLDFPSNPRREGQAGERAAWWWSNTHRYADLTLTLRSTGEKILLCGVHLEPRNPVGQGQVMANLAGAVVNRLDVNYVVVAGTFHEQLITRQPNQAGPLHHPVLNHLQGFALVADGQATTSGGNAGDDIAFMTRVGGAALQISQQSSVPNVDQVEGFGLDTAGNHKMVRATFY